MRWTATREDVPFIELNGMTRMLYEARTIPLPKSKSQTATECLQSVGYRR